MVQADKIVGDPVAEGVFLREGSGIIQKLPFECRIAVANRRGLDQQPGAPLVAGILFHKIPRGSDDGVPVLRFAPDRSLEKKRHQAKPRVGPLLRGGVGRFFQGRENAHRLVGLLRDMVHFSGCRQDRCQPEPRIKSLRGGGILGEETFDQSLLLGQVGSCQNLRFLAGRRLLRRSGIHRHDHRPLGVRRRKRAGRANQPGSDQKKPHFSGTLIVVNIARWSLALYQIRELLIPLLSMLISGQSPWLTIR